MEDLDLKKLNTDFHIKIDYKYRCTENLKNKISLRVWK